MTSDASVTSISEPDTRTEADESTGLLEAALFEAKRVLVGQDLMIERLFICWLARGHCLLEGAPGLAKTLAAETVAKVIGGTFARLQFTPDLMPADIVGTRIYRPSQEAFDVELGPIFANVVLADEINRAPAKVQSALLEVMAERHVSIGGVTYVAPDPFLVLATQNPLESEGVYPLPEAQRDRFLMKVLVGFPTRSEEAQIARRMSVHPPSADCIIPREQLTALQAAADEVFVHDAVLDYAVRLVFATPRTGRARPCGARPADRARCQSTRATLASAVDRTRARAPAWSSPSPAPRRVRRRPRRAASPRAAHLRGAGRRGRRRGDRRAHHAHRGGAPRHAHPGRPGPLQSVADTTGGTAFEAASADQLAASTTTSRAGSATTRSSGRSCAGSSGSV